MHIDVEKIPYRGRADGPGCSQDFFFLILFVEPKKEIHIILLLAFSSIYTYIHDTQIHSSYSFDSNFITYSL